MSVLRKVFFSVSFLFIIAADWLMRLCSLLRSRKRIEKHLRRNRTVSKKAPELGKKDGFIEDQRLLAGTYVFGRAASENLCGCVAVYNALVHLGHAVPLPDIIRDFEERGMLLSGRLGIAPSAVTQYFRKRGFPVKWFSGKAIANAPENGDCYILMGFNDEDHLFYGAHFMAVTVRNRQYSLHNTGMGSAVVSGSLREAIGSLRTGGRRFRPVYLLWIRNL